MGLTAAGTEIVTGAGMEGLSALTTEGTAIGGVFATIALIYVLGYLDLLDSIATEYAQVRQMLAVTVVPLGMVFLGIVLSEVDKIL